MIIIKYLSVTGAEIGEHFYESDSLQEAEDYVKGQLSRDEIFASTSKGQEITIFKTEHIAGYKMILRTPARVTVKPF